MTIKNNDAVTTPTTPQQPSAPSEAELYYGTSDLLSQDSIPIASAVPIHDDETTRPFLNPPYDYADPAPSSASTPLAPAAVTTATLVGGITQLHGLGLDPQVVTCPHCQHRGRTLISRLVDLCTVMAMGILLLLFWPICWLPLVLKGCKRTEHYCGQCHRKVGSVPSCSKGCGCCGC